MKICIIGTGYVGLVASACFAGAGNTVYSVDKDVDKIELLQQGLIPIYEPGLAEIVVTNSEQSRLIFTSDLELGLSAADIVFIAVGTPQNVDGSADLSHVFSVCEEICVLAKKPLCIGTKSTVPVGTGDEIEKIFQKRLRHRFSVFSNPEFLKEGDAVHDFMKPERVIIGHHDDSITPLLEELYAPFTHQQQRLIFMSRRSAELAKYAANTMLALRISFMNEMARLCDTVGTNIADIRMAIGADTRIGPSFLHPGLGYGGSCFPKDVQALQNYATSLGTPLQIVAATHRVNEAQIEYAFSRLKFLCDGNVRALRIAVWGVAFKSRTDDIRESPALKLVDRLLAEGAEVHVYDPQALDNTKLAYLEKLHYHGSHDSCAESADLLVIGTDWNEFKSPDFIELKKRMRIPAIFDGRNLFNPEYVKRLGFKYVGIGSS